MESFTEETFELEELPQSLKSSRKLVADFLAKFDLVYDTLDSYVGLFAVTSWLPVVVIKGQRLNVSL